MSPAHKVSFAVVGFGHIGKRHCEEIVRHEEAVLAGIADIEVNKVAEANEKYGQGVPVYTDMAEMLDSIEADTVNICTPNGTHVGLAKEAIKRGTHVVIEKPIGLSSVSIKSLLRTAKKNDKNVYCVLQNRYSPPVKFLNDLIRNERFGKVFLVQVNCFWNRDDRYYTPGTWRGTKELDGGPLYTQFSHFIDLLTWNFGELKIESSYLANYSHPDQKDLEDSGVFNFKTKSGALGTFSYSTSVWQRNMESSITIIGEKGTFKLGGQYMDRIDYFDIEGMELPVLEKTKAANQYGGYSGSAANHDQFIANVILDIQGKPADLPSINDALSSVKMIEKIYRKRNSRTIYRQ